VATLPDTNQPYYYAGLQNWSWQSEQRSKHSECF
jgi:hypothetical protein